MSKREKFFLIWVAITTPLAMLLTITGGILSVFNSFIGRNVMFIGLGIAFFGIMIPYITWCICGIIELTRED